MNFALKIALNSNGVEIIKNIILTSKGRPTHIFFKGNIVYSKYLIPYNAARITQFKEL